MCHGLVQQIRADADELFKQRESLALRRELVTKILMQSHATVQQVKQRLHALELGVELQKLEFAEEIEAFIADAGNEIELGLQDRVRGKDWLNESVWKNFAKNQHGRALQARYEKLKWRHERRVELLEKELMLFQKELLVSRPQLLRSIDQKEFVETWAASVISSAGHEFYRSSGKFYDLDDRLSWRRIAAKWPGICNPDRAPSRPLVARSSDRWPSPIFIRHLPTQRSASKRKFAISCMTLTKASGKCCRERKKHRPRRSRPS